MSSADLPAELSSQSGPVPPVSQRKLALPLRLAVRFENAIVIFALAMMVLLPITDSAVRLLKKVLSWLMAAAPSWQEHWQTASDFTARLVITGSSEFVQHGSLIVGLVGAAIAARENRLLSLATATMFPAGNVRTVARIIGAAVGAAIAAFLAIAAAQYVELDRPYSHEIAYGIPVWTMALVLPIGFALIALSILYHSADRWRLRWIAPLLALGLIVLCIWAPVDPSRLVVPAFVVLAAATILGAPIFAVLGGSALILFWGAGGPIASIAIDHYSLATKPFLATIPLFTLAGYFLAEGGASQRLVRVFGALFGSIRGGPAVVTALLCAFFTSFTGASGVTILALGGVLMPILLSARYSDRAALGLLTGAGSLGMLFPPCVPLVLYAIIAQLPIEDIFLGAIIPGAIMVVMTAALGVWMGPKVRPQRGFELISLPPGVQSDATTQPVEQPLAQFNVREALSAVWAAKWELLIPVVAMAGLFGGFATPVEASAITAFYAFLTQTFIWRDLSLRKGVPHVLTECGLVIGGVLLILGVAQGFTNYLIDAQVPDRAIDWLTSSVHSPYAFLLLLNLFLLVVGGLMDVYPAIVVVVPLIVPIGRAYGIDPIHLGVIFLANLEMGFLMPPLGMNLLLSSYRFKKPMPEVYRAIIPVLIVQFIGVLLITYVPFLTTMLPRWLGH